MDNERITDGRRGRMTR